MVRSRQARYILILKITLLCVMGVSMGQLMNPDYHGQGGGANGGGANGGGANGGTNGTNVMSEPSHNYAPYNPMMPFPHTGPDVHHFPHETMHDMSEPSHKYAPYNPMMPFPHTGPDGHHFPHETMHDMSEPSYRYAPYNPMMPFPHIGPDVHHFSHETMLDLHRPSYKSHPHPPIMPIHSMSPELAEVGSNDLLPSISGDTCQLQMDRGSCTDMLPRYYYDIHTRECHLFTYGGCHGNANNFITKEECEHACLGHISSHISFRTHPHEMDPSNSDLDLFYRKRRPRHCYLPKEIGPCLASFIRYHYNPRSGRCEIFVFGGCDGNANNFETYEECKDICKALLYYLKQLLRSYEPSHKHAPHNPMMPFSHTGHDVHHFPHETMHDMIEPSHEYAPYNPMMPFPHTGHDVHHFPHKTMLGNYYGY